MKTEIFENYLLFLNRGNKETNGVSKEFAELHPNYKEDNETNKGCWNCSGCSGCSDCSDCSGCSGCSGCSRCSRCSRCSGCSDCSDCSGCSGCSGCSRCSDLRNARPIEQKENESVMIVPVIENIHQKVYEAVTKTDESLDMSEWHTCETTHCRAGWVVQLAGEAGLKLESQTSTLFAAQQIYFKSCPKINVSPVRFYESNEVALKDIERCAEEEKKLNA